VEWFQIVLQAQPGAGVFTGPIAVLIDAWTGGEAAHHAVGVAATSAGRLQVALSGGVTWPRPLTRCSCSTAAASR
jgi:hypothetical protein